MKKDKIKRSLVPLPTSSACPLLSGSFLHLGFDLFPHETIRSNILYNFSFLMFITAVGIQCIVQHIVFTMFKRMTVSNYHLLFNRSTSILNSFHTLTNLFLQDKTVTLIIQFYHTFIFNIFKFCVLNFIHDIYTMPYDHIYISSPTTSTYALQHTHS